MIKKEIIIFGVAMFALAMSSCFSVQIVSSKTKIIELGKIKTAKAETENKTQLQKNEREKNSFETKETKGEIQERGRKNNCESIQTRVQTKINNYESMQEQHRNMLGELSIRGEQLATTFREKKLETATLDTYLLTLKEKLKELEIEHKAFIDGLISTEKVACEEDRQKFRESLAKTRKMSTQVRFKLVEIREFYQMKIRAEALELKTQLISVETIKTKEKS